MQRKNNNNNSNSGTYAEELVENIYIIVYYPPLPPPPPPPDVSEGRFYKDNNCGDINRQQISIKMKRDRTKKIRNTIIISVSHGKTNSGLNGISVHRKG